MLGQYDDKIVLLIPQHILEPAILFSIFKIAFKENYYNLDIDIFQ